MRNVGRISFTCLIGFPRSKPKLELTIIETQKVMNRSRNATSLHFLLCFMMSLLPPFGIPSSASLDDGYFPAIGPNGPPIFLHTPCNCENKRGRQKLYAEQGERKEEEKGEARKGQECNRGLWE